MRPVSRRIWRAWVALGGGALAISCGTAHPARRPADEATEQSPCLPDAEGPPGARMFHKFDPQRTGSVTLEQFVGHREHRFESLDADGDGRVTRAELDARRAGDPPEQVAATFARFDTNGDGAITRAEWNAGETARFVRIDANHDGSVTRDEFLAERARVCAERGEGPGAP